MKKLLLACLLFTSATLFGQGTFYWVGGNATTPTSARINTLANWNSSLDGTGSVRGNNSNPDVLIFNGTNLGGATPVTGPITVNSDGAITCAQMKYINNANVSIVRPTSGTTTITMVGGDGDDFSVDAGATAGFTSTVGSVRIDMSNTCTGIVNGNMRTVTSLQFRITNTTTGPPGTFVFTNGSTFTTNITGTSSYAFGNNSQGAEKWVVFQSGSHLYYEGGGSPMGSNATFTPIEMKPGSVWHHRANNGNGNFFTRRSFGDITVENNATLTADGPINRIYNLSVNAGSSFVTHTSGQTVILGQLSVNGTLSSPAAATNELLFGGTGSQLIQGTGTIDIASIIVGANSSVNLLKNVAIQNAANVYGKISFGINQITGAGIFRANGPTAPVAGTGNTIDGSFQVSGVNGITATQRGLTITGNGIPANTTITTISATGDTIFISNAATATNGAVALSAHNDGAVLETSNSNGFNPATGSVVVTGVQTYEDDLNYRILSATTWPFGITTATAATAINADSILIGASVTTNRSFTVRSSLSLNGKLTLRPLDVAHIANGAVINGTFGASNYIFTDYSTATGEQGRVQLDGIATATTIPVGTAANYLPVRLTPASASDFSVAVFEGITANGLVNGTPLTPLQKQTVANAVWNIDRTNGSGTSDVELNWTPGLEGSTFATLPDTDIGLIYNTGIAYTLPIGTADNTANRTVANVSNFGAFSAGAVAQVDPFVFNAIPTKVYGDVDFNGGATSLNTAQPIIYTSNNPLVATIVAGSIHITGAGVATITATQATDGLYPDASLSQTLTVDKASLTITADNKTKFEGQANPALTATYAGLVYGETAAALLTPAILTTTAVTASPAGTYPINVTGATSNNYTITLVNGTLTVQPRTAQTITFNAIPVKAYGNADFATGGTSTNNTIPITYTSSNTNVATILANNNIHIVGAGTTTITASQAGSAGYFPAPDVARTLTVNKVPLVIRVRDTTRVEGQPNPPFTFTAVGFVLGETPANLLTPVTATTTATQTSPAGYYPITLSGATSNNYTVTLSNGRLTITPLAGTNTQYINSFQVNNSLLTVRVFSPEPGLADITLYNFYGMPLMKKNTFIPVGFISNDLPISTLPSGIYYVTVRGNGANLKKTVAITKQ